MSYVQSLYVLCPGKMLVFINFCPKIPLSKDSCRFKPVHWSAVRVNWLVSIWWVFIKKNVQIEWLYPSGYMVWIGHKWEFQMIFKTSRWFMSCITRMSIFLLKFWMETHCKWIGQPMINNNNSNNNTNNGNNNSNSAIMLQTLTDLLTQT